MPCYKKLTFLGPSEDTENSMERQQISPAGIPPVVSLDIKCASTSLRRLSETMEISEIRVLMKYEFHRGATTRQAVANINSVFGIQVATNATVARRFKKFRSGDFDLSNEPRGQPKTRWIMTS
ncbi:mariner-7 protein [Nephila pilipes]|uniref:Mariner-7 protein n=1 Tax=Nephila pilipes TaxID=299642 RepID=A0A8X6MNQ6_NEPPI|nr:mariner-7 protein [Nephila pilipes]